MYLCTEVILEWVNEKGNYEGFEILLIYNSYGRGCSVARHLALASGGERVALGASHSVVGAFLAASACRGRTADGFLS